MKIYLDEKRQTDPLVFSFSSSSNLGSSQAAAGFLVFLVTTLSGKRYISSHQIIGYVLGRLTIDLPFLISTPRTRVHIVSI